jgi:hypothetical protein
VNRLPPVGLMLFSLGAGGAPPPVGAGVVAVVVVVVVVVVSGAFSSLAQAAVIAPIAMIAEAPEIAASRRPKRRESMCSPIHVLTRRGGRPREGDGLRPRDSSCCGEPQEALSVPGAHKPAA